MVRNPEKCNPRGSFADRLRTFGAKALAIFGIASTAIAGAGCNNSEVNDPNSNITPDTVATDTQGIPSTKETPPSPEPHNTEPPSPEDDKNPLEIKGTEELAEKLKNATTLNEQRYLLSEWTNLNTDKKIETDENGIVHTTKENQANAMLELGRHEVAKLKLVSEINRQGYAKGGGKLTPEAERIVNAYFNTSTVGQAKKKIGITLGMAEFPNDEEYKQYQFKETLAEATGKDSKYPPYLARDNFNTDVSAETGDLTQPKWGINWSGDHISKYQAALSTESGGISEFTVVFKYDTSCDSEVFNKPNEEQVIDYTDYVQQVCLTGEILGNRIVWKDSKIPFMKDGVNIPISEIPEVQESAKTRPS